MFSGDGWYAMYVAQTADGNPDFAWTSRMPVVAWVDTTASSDADVTVHGFVPKYGSATLLRADEVTFTGGDGREQVFTMYVRLDADAASGADDGA